MALPGGAAALLSAANLGFALSRDGWDLAGGWFDSLFGSGGKPPSSMLLRAIFRSFRFVEGFVAGLLAWAASFPGSLRLSASVLWFALSAVSPFRDL